MSLTGINPSCIVWCRKTWQVNWEGIAFVKIYFKWIFLNGFEVYFTISNANSHEVCLIMESWVDNHLDVDRGSRRGLNGDSASTRGLNVSVILMRQNFSHHPIHRAQANHRWLMLLDPLNTHHVATYDGNKAGLHIVHATGRCTFSEFNFHGFFPPQLLQT